MRRFRELDEAIAILERLLKSEGSELAHEGRLRKTLRELKTIKRGGKTDRRRLIRAVALISKVVCEEFLKDDDRTNGGEQG